MSRNFNDTRNKADACFQQLIAVDSAIRSHNQSKLLLDETQIKAQVIALHAAESHAIRNALLAILDQQGMILDLIQDMLSEDDSEDSN